MPSATARRNLIVYGALLAVALAICGWQIGEHRRVKHAAAQTLINRGRDITSTLGVVVRSQRRFGLIVSKDRIESSLQDLVRHGELESIAILGSTGETIASAGTPIELTPEMLRERGVYWREHALTIMNLMDLGSNTGDDGYHPQSPIVVADEKLSRAFRPPAGFRRPGEPPRPPTDSATTSTASSSSPPSPPTEPVEEKTGSVAPPPPPPPDGQPGRNFMWRAPFGRPPWMEPAEYEAVIQKQGVHSLVISLSTDPMQEIVQNDLVLRSLVSLLAIAAATLSAFAWHNLTQNADLQIRFIKACEANAHLKEMNLAAAGLAHETRNPLNLIRGFAQMIAMQPEISPKLKTHASAIMEEADRVAVQLNEFINYSKPREAHLGPVSVARVAADVARTLTPDTEEKKIQLTLTDSPLQIEADEQLLRQALFNLLLNAVQSVESGGHIEVALIAAGPREATLEVRDNGPGVVPAQREAIFKPYVTLRPKGVGLGLAIVQQIVAAHGWEIACAENSPRGALFRISHLRVTTDTA